MEDKVTERKLVKMLLKTYFSHIQGYIYPHIVAVMSLYLVFVGHSLQCLSKTTTILHQSISSVMVKVILGEKIASPKMIFVWMFSYLMYLYTVVEKCIMNSFLFFIKYMYYFKQFSS